MPCGDARRMSAGVTKMDWLVRASRHASLCHAVSGRMGVTSCPSAQGGQSHAADGHGLRYRLCRSHGTGCQGV
jgi:hypothetical protein